MHGHVNEAEFLASISTFLGFLYSSMAIMNFGAAVFLWRRRHAARAGDTEPCSGSAVWIWLAVAILFLAMAPMAFSGDPRLMKLISLPQFVRDAADRVMGPMVFVVGGFVALWVLYRGRTFFSRPNVAWGMLNVALLLLALSMTDPDFKAIVAKPDNVPIVSLVFLLGFFTWLATRKAVLNDARLAQGMPPLESEDNEKVLVWPDLVYIELICMVALTALLLFWSIGLKAPLEGPASTVDTPNPSKAPWYFLGLQEMLVYFDPWMSGVVIPSLIILGLIAIPYIDTNEQGNGYYTINERNFAYVTFQFGFLVLWMALMLMGTFFRGPNWSFFGFYETWDLHKIEALTNVRLSERFWIDLLGLPPPEATAGAGVFASLGAILLREIPGIGLVSVYFIVLPPLLAKRTRTFRAMYSRLGFGRYLVLILLLLIMALLPIKMACRWAFHLDYFISVPEYSFFL